MYSHRIVAFMLFTSLFFISSSLFAGLTWFILYLHSSAASPSPDDLHNGIITTRPSEEKPSRAEVDDDLTISPSVSSRPGLASYSSSGSISQTYPPVTQLSTKEEYRQGLKHSHRAESSTSEPSREEDIGSVTTQVKSDDDTASGYGEDDDIETIERHPISEMTF
jgi:cytoskeletal protein RodZ